MSVAHLETTDSGQELGEINAHDAGPAEIGEPAGPAAVSEIAVAEGAEIDASACAHCGSVEPWGMSSWCPRCGFYPALGTWTVTTPHVETPEPVESHGQRLLLLWKSIPNWGWILAGGVVASLGVGVAGHFLTSENGWDRTIWALAQAVLGSLMFLTAHFWCFGIAILKSANFGIFDFLMKPMAIWGVAFKQLPKSRRRVWLGAWGLALTVSALAIVGGIRYSVVFEDWGIEKQADEKLVAATLQKSKAEHSKHSLEGASNDFSDKAEIDEADPTSEELKKLPKATDCVVIGYTQNSAGTDVAELVLASVLDDELRYVGTISRGIPETVRKQLDRKLAGLKRDQPFVPCKVGARWVDPVVTCRVRFKAWNDHNLLSGPIFDQLLAELQ